MTAVLQRVAELAKEENITIGALEKRIGASKGVLSRAIQANTDIQCKWLEKIVENFPSRSSTWLLTGIDPLDELSHRFSDIIQIMDALSLEDIASYFGVSATELGNFTNNMELPEKPFDFVKFFKAWPEFNYQWLLVGSGKMFNDGYDRASVRDKIYKTHLQRDYEQVRKELGLTSNVSATVKDLITFVRIPLLPYDAVAGYGSFDFQDLPVEDYYSIGDFKGADFLIRVKGDSMVPKFNGGDIVACKKIEEVTFWQWHKIYAICTRNQGILIKRVEPDPNNPAFIQCVSENPSYKPFFIHEDEIVSIALVMGAVTLE